MIITIPFRTPTINHLYWHRGHVKILKTEAKKLRKEIDEIVRKIVFVNPGIWKNLKDKPLGVDVSIFEDWYCNNGSVKKLDVANREKFLVDSVFKALGIDDKFIFYQSMRKVQSATQEKAVITIEVL